MGYSHAAANLAAIRKLERDTELLLDALDEIDPDLGRWLRSDSDQHPHSRPVGAGDPCDLSLATISSKS
jgi:hypothetical protein